MWFICFLIAILASTIGATSGIGGGIIIKPIMDSMGFLDLPTINFMSGCTVLAMSLSSFLRRQKSGLKLDYAVSLYLSAGGALGGYFGKMIFSTLGNSLALVQTTLLLAINIAVFFFMKNKIVFYKKIQNKFISLTIGLFLGIISSFLGIGGGPINIAALYYFFNMTAKLAARNSLLIILFSQCTSLFTTIVTNTVPTFDFTLLLAMCAGGVMGAFIGGAISSRVSDKAIESFFTFVLLGLILLNLYNWLGVIL